MSAKKARCRLYPITIISITNLFVYMNRVAITGVLNEIQQQFLLSESGVGLLQTLYIVAMIIGGPIFGYFGDRYDRRKVIIIATILWIVASLWASFIYDLVEVFFLLRALAGAGDAGFLAIAPAMISDYYKPEERYIMLTIYYLAFPFGAGLGYMVGAEIAILLKNWRWAVRIVPCIGVLSVFMLFFLRKCPRGASEGSNFKISAWKQDVKAIITNKTYLMTVAAFTCVTFIGGASGWWAPKVLTMGLNLQKDEYDSSTPSLLIFGVVVVSSGIIGVTLGYGLSKWLNKKYDRADPLICGIGMFISAPLMGLTFYTAPYSTTCCYLLGFVGFTAVNLQPAIVSNIIISVMLPTRRAQAHGILLFLCHALGDCGSPYFFGLTTDLFRPLFEKNGQRTTRTHYMGFLCSISLPKIGRNNDRKWPNLPKR
ncbi:unnamed protein product [Brassicogethes aeneus]|uniref:Major facilitator superfamily (MFS) profile domain-containing protein n=1 Tax=Brassicogethes aeneus TaxID=1431903 RepID=A0A9P0FKV4_BRAAE|nr:unnamed protein product [Brassicogethes aeneus]